MADQTILTFIILIITYPRINQVLEFMKIVLRIKIVYSFIFELDYHFLNNSTIYLCVFLTLFLPPLCSDASPVASCRETFRKARSRCAGPAWTGSWCWTRSRRETAAAAGERSPRTEGKSDIARWRQMNWKECKNFNFNVDSFNFIVFSFKTNIFCSRLFINKGETYLLFRV